jgi:hypothetical protein
MKIILCASHHQLAIGYSRVACAILNHLAEQGHEMVHFAFSNFEPEHNIDRKMSDKVRIIDTFAERRAKKTDAMAQKFMETDEGFLKELKGSLKANAGAKSALTEKEIESFKISFGMRNYEYGGEMLADTLVAEKPDMVVVYNDVLVVTNMLSRIPRGDRRPKVVVYLDMVLPQQHTDQLKYIFANCDHVLAFSKVWRDELIERGFARDQISVLRHGIDPPVITDRRAARKTLKIDGRRVIDLDDFVILNSNRNQHRKLWDVSVFAFLEFLKRAKFDPRIKFVANTELHNGGYDLMKLIETGKDRVNIEGNMQQVLKHFIFTHHLSDEQMQLLFDACDVGINTCTGEGVGLCSLEHAAHGKPQVVTRAGGLIDIFEAEHPECLVEPKLGIYSPKNLDGHGGIQNMCDYRDFATKLMKLYLSYSPLEFNIKRWLWPRALRNLNARLISVERRRVIDIVHHVDTKMQRMRMELLKTAVDIFVVVSKKEKKKRTDGGDIHHVRSMSEFETKHGDILIDGDVRALVTPNVLIELRHMMSDQCLSKIGSVVPMLSKSKKTTKGTVRGPTFTMVGSSGAVSQLPVQGVGWFISGQPATKGEARHEVPETLKALKQLTAALRASAKV